jgi:hypothetical protein
MPVRGERPTFPRAPKPPTGIFSTRGKQKMDDNSYFQNKDTLSYAYGRGTRSKPTGNAHQGKRHQSPK